MNIFPGKADCGSRTDEQEQTIALYSLCSLGIFSFFTVIKGNRFLHKVMLLFVFVKESTLYLG